MVEKIVITPNRIRAVGNVIQSHTLEDYQFMDCNVLEDKDIINGIEFGIMRMTYQDPNALFGFDLLRKYLFVNHDTATLGFEDKSLELNATGLLIGFSDKELYVMDDPLLFYDPCTPEYLSDNYGTIIPVDPSTTVNYTSYNISNDCYYTRANGDWGILPITALEGADNYKITAKFKRPGSNAAYQGGFSFANPSQPSDNWFVRMRGDGKVDYGKQSSQETLASALGDAWVTIELVITGQTVVISVYDGDTLKGTATATNPISDSQIGLHLIAGSSYGFYVKEIRAELI